MSKLDYKEQFEETEEDIKAREAKRKIGPHKESGRSVFDAQREIVKKSETPRDQEKSE